MEDKPYMLNIQNVVKTLQKNEGTSHSVPNSFGLSQEFADEHKEEMLKICALSDTKTEVICKLLLLCMKYSVTDEEFIYIFYVGLMMYGLGIQVEDPVEDFVIKMAGLLKRRGLPDEDN